MGCGVDCYGMRGATAVARFLVSRFSLGTVPNEKRETRNGCTILDNAPVQRISPVLSRFLDFCRRPAAYRRDRYLLIPVDRKPAHLTRRIAYRLHTRRCQSEA